MFLVSVKDSGRFSAQSEREKSMKCTHPHEPANAIRVENTGQLNKDPESRRTASHHKCLEPVVGPDGKLYQTYVHEDCAIREGVHW
jgi:hypothetical protein